MRFDRSNDSEHDPIQDTQFFDAPLDASFDIPTSAAERREIRFREREARRPAEARPRDRAARARGGAGRDAEGFNWTKLAIGSAIAAVLLIGAGWGIASVYRTNADRSAAAAVAKANAAGKVTTSPKKAKAKKKAKPSKPSSGSTKSSGTSSKATATQAVARTSKPAATTRSVASVSTGSKTVASVSSGDVVVIDAGHQGKGDSSLEPIGPGSSQMKPKVADGASGAKAPHDESEVNLQVALRLRTALQARGVKVIMVRTSQNVNISNSQRAAIANNAHAALFIRLHCDGIASSSKHGLSTLIPANNHWTAPIVSSSAKAGRIVQLAALKATGASDAGVVQRSDLSGFNWSKVPTVLVEMGFMSNPAEDAALVSASYQNKLATGLANGVTEYLKAR